MLPNTSTNKSVPFSQQHRSLEPQTFWLRCLRWLDGYASKAPQQLQLIQVVQMPRIPCWVGLRGRRHALPTIADQRNAFPDTDPTMGYSQVHSVDSIITLVSHHVLRCRGDARWRKTSLVQLRGCHAPFAFLLLDLSRSTTSLENRSTSSSHFIYMFAYTKTTLGTQAS